MRYCTTMCVKFSTCYNRVVCEVFYVELSSSFPSKINLMWLIIKYWTLVDCGWVSELMNV